jgi:hypothetical protein
MSQDLLTCQGGVQINTAIKTGGGPVTISVDLPNGPKPGTIWVVDLATVLAFLGVGDGTFAGLCEIDVVPIGTPIPDSLDTLDAPALNARGPNMFMTPGGQVGMVVGYNNGSYVNFSGRGPVIVPAGYTLRGIVASEVGMATESMIQITAQLRILNQS